MKTQAVAQALARSGRILAILGGCSLLPWTHEAAAALTDLSNAPIASAQSAAVKPNIMLLMDASDSMRASHMPDDLEQLDSDEQAIGYRSYQCNPVYYNPSQTYVLPKVVDASDAALPLMDAPTPSFTAAPYNYYSPAILSPQGGTSVNLSSAFQAFDFQTRLGLGQGTTALSRSDAPQAAYYYLYSVAGPQTYNAAPCTDVLGTVSSAAGGSWTRVLVSATEQSNFAIWYSYYRTRIALVKSGIGRAFKDMGDNYRVGFITVSPLVAGNAADPNVPPLAGSAVDPAKYQAIDDFTVAQRKNVYSKLYSQSPGGASPSREGLARVGRHYSDYGAGVVGTSALRSVGINKGMPEDPVQNACQRNYTIMTTDGYWNKTFETAGAVQMDGTTLVGQQDSPLSAPMGVCDGNGNGKESNRQCAPRPMFDGTSSYLDQQQLYDYQALSCSNNDNQTVTNYTRSVEQYFNTTRGQSRQTDTLTYENTRTSKVTTTQTIDQKQLKESVTHQAKTVTRSTQRDTVSTQSVRTLARVTTQVLRNDWQQKIQYQYVMMTVQTASYQAWSMTRTVEQWQQVGNDGSTWSYVLACSAGTLGTSGCRLSNNSLLDQPVDPLYCSNQDPLPGNNYTRITCSALLDSGLLALDPSAACIGDNQALVTNPLGRQSCILNTTVSYVDPTLCTDSTSDTTVVSCGPIQTPSLSSGPASGDNVADCTAANQVTTNLLLPPVSPPAVAGTDNNYQLLCPTVVITAPNGASITNAVAQQYAVDPLTCAVTAGVPPTAASSTNATGLTTTCTPSVVSTPVPTTVCAGPCLAVPASAPHWIATTYSLVIQSDGYVARSVCPATSTTYAAAPPYAQTDCTLVSDNSYYVDTALCVVGPTFNATSGQTSSCGSTTISGPTIVPTCSHSFISPNTTSCATVTDVASHAVASCTYATGTTVLGNQTYSCGTSTTLGIAVEPDSCTPGTASINVAGITTTTTCHAKSVVTSYVQKDTCSAIAAGPGVKTVVDCPVTTPTPLGPVAPGFCSPGTVFNAVTGDTSVCTNTTTGPTQETVGTACPGAAYDPGLGAGYSATTATDPTTQTQTRCLMYDSGPTLIGEVCTPGITSGTDLTQQICSMSTVAAAAPDADCTTSFFSWNGQTYHQTCNASVLPSTAVSHAACQAASAAASAASPVTSSVSCDPIIDSWQLQSRYTTSSYAQTLSAGTALGAPALVSSIGPTDWVNASACTLTLTTPMPVDAIASVLASAASPAIDPVALTQTDADGGNSAACTSWPCRIYPTATGNGSQNSLADVAQYYYATDLRAAWVNSIQVPPTAGNEDDRAPHQHMVTYAVALGVSGSLAFDPDYRNPANLMGDFPAIRAGATVPGQVGGTGQVAWPVWPTATIEASLNPLDFSDPRSIDDFWHAAVNGRGRYYSAGNASSMAASISGALDDINTSVASGNGATPSTSAPTSADNTVFVPSFTNVGWSGDIQAHTFDLSASVAAGSNTWSARAALQLLVGPAADSRNIVFRKAGGSAMTSGSNLADFSYVNLVAAGKQSYFDATVAPGWSQYTSMDADQLASAAGANLVNFLRGQREHEDFAVGAVLTGVPLKLYRKRDAVLGDIVGSQPSYVKGPSASYADAGYAAFKSTAAARKKMVYAGANDGMLHAFYAPQPADANWTDAGKEAWAYVPSQVMPNLYRLADVQYSANHRFFVDGTATVGDVCISNPCVSADDWRTILVGGLNAGGKGYYALDITDPDQPKSLWEFTTASTGGSKLGFSYGRPILSKLADGTWVVMFTSGYNNADGNGYLYILNAVTGVQTTVSPMATGVGSASDPSGLREINNWVSNVATDNTTQRVYGGDLLGNVWRFDVNGSAGALRLATIKDSSGVVQPITTRLELAEIGGDAYVYAGTGRLLGLSDLATTQTQSIYSFKDIGATYSNAGVADGNVRPSLKQMVLTTTIPKLSDGQPDLANATRSIACSSSALVCAQTTGWMVDLPETGERMNLDFRAGKGTLAFVTNVPTADLCSAGHSWLNYVDEVSGNPVPGETGYSNAGVILDASSLAVGVAMVDVSERLKAIGVSASGQTKVKDIPWSSPVPVGKRISWREVEP